MNTATTTSLVLVIIGGLNWLLVGLFKYDIVASVFGGAESAIARVIYTVVGLAALYLIANYSKLSGNKS